MDTLYSSKILDYAADIPRARRLEAPAASAFKRSRLCGSEVTVDLDVEAGRVSDFGMEAKACALGQCSASIVAQTIVGSTPEELRRVASAMRAMLKEGGPPPEGRWAELAILEPVKDYPQRHASTLLVFEAVVDCLDQIEGRERAAAPGCAAGEAGP
ncbi:MAG: iron-sulfur cluster assembly scaffold protein [Pseudomonadota bacterium]